MNKNYPFTTKCNNKKIKLSIVIPVYNELDVLPICLERLKNVLDSLTCDYELVFVDDGSDDGSIEWLLDQSVNRGGLRIVKLSRNFGKESAMSAGIDVAQGDAVILFDADMQDPPELIPKMLEKWYDGADIVLMQRRKRYGESKLKRFTARLFYRVLNSLASVDIPEDVGDFRLMSRRAIDGVKQMPERNRFMKGMFAWIGMPTVTLRYDREPRVAGKTKWSYLELLQFAFEGITSFTIKPLKVAIHLGVLTAMIGGLYGLWIIFKAIVFGDPVQGYPSLVAIITFLGGVQLLTLGVMGEYVGKTYIETKQRPVYLIQDIVDLSSEED